MLKAEQIPDEVFEAFQKAWAVTSTLSTKECLAAALNAWPGAFPWTFSGPLEGHGYVLPLPKEPRDEA